MLTNLRGMVATVSWAAWSTTLAAATLSGTFNLSGTVTVSQAGGAHLISWLSDGPSMMDNQATVGVTGLTGNFVGLGGVPVTIQDLSDQWVDTEFHPANPFVTFQSAPQLPQLLIDIIYRGINSPAEALPPQRLPARSAGCPIRLSTSRILPEADRELALCLEAKQTTAYRLGWGISLHNSALRTSPCWPT